MKKLLIILLLIVGCSKPIEDSTLINKDGLMYLPDSDKPYTGEVFTNYSTGEKEYQGKYENGLLIEYSYLKKDGSVKVPVNGETLIDRGDLLYELNGQKPYTGDVFELYKDGGRKLNGSIKGGMKNKLWIYYHENGQIEKEGNYKDGEPDGKYTSYYENGQIWEEGNYRDGERNGKWIYYTEIGNGRYEVIYTDGAYDVVTFINNLHQTHTGILLTEETWEDGQYLYQDQTDYDFSIYPNITVTIKDGKVDGKLTWYYENGQIKNEGNWKDGKEDGKVTYYNEDGSISSAEEYKDGVRVDAGQITSEQNSELENTPAPVETISPETPSETPIETAPLEDANPDIGVVENKSPIIDKPAVSPEPVEGEPQILAAELIEASNFTNKLPLNSNDFLAENKDRESTNILTLFAPFTITITTLEETKLNLSKITGGVSTGLINEAIEGGKKFEFDFEDTINFEFWSNAHIKVKLNEIPLDKFLSDDGLSVRGSYEAEKSQLYLGFYQN